MSSISQSTKGSWFSWLRSLLHKFGILKKSGRVLFLGLDNAGKTSLTHVLVTGKFCQHPPTTFASKQEVVIGNLKLQAIDVGGHEAAREIWADYFGCADAIVYLIDTLDRDRLEIAKEELHKLLTTLPSVPILILGNKTDVPRAATRTELERILRLHELDRQGPVRLEMCSVLQSKGLQGGFQWLGEQF
mmetsp:Transcript_63507/g.150472  ORF Transcript_63507/g.150472 Transcript_63507/m.150472 type:complete len:189 (+) Transcript_63507:64-630(+)